MKYAQMIRATIIVFGFMTIAFTHQLRGQNLDSISSTRFEVLWQEKITTSLTATQGKAQPFADALLLNAAISINDTAHVAEILSKYRTIEGASIVALKRTFEDDPLILNALGPLKSNTTKIVSLEQLNIFNEISQSVNAIFGGVLSPPVFIDNISQLVSDRFKEELNIAYIQRLRIELEQPRFRDVKALLPNAFNTLLNNDPVEYKSFVPTLRSAFALDLAAIPEHLPTVILNNQDQLQNAKSLFASALSALHIFNNLDDHPADIIEELAIQPFLEEWPALNQVLDLVSGFSRNFRGVNTLAGWRSLKELSQLQRGQSFELFIGLTLIKERESGIWDAIDSETYQTIKGLLLPDSRPLRKAYQVYDAIGNIQQLVETFNALTTSGLAFNSAQYKTYMQRLLSLLENSIEWGELLEVIDSEANVRQVIELTSQVFGISEQIADQELDQVVVFAISTLQQLFAQADSTDFIRLFSRYANFAVDLINADTSTLALTVLETAALPVQSYRTKRRYPFEVSLNAYPGLFGAIEFLDERDLETINQNNVNVVERDQFTFGFTAPIGLAFSFSKGQYDLNSSPQYASSSIFLSLIDVGALTAFRIQEETDLLPELKFENIFAPGIHYVYGFKNSPISIGGGIQYGPGLRRVSANELSVSASGWRAGIFLGVDIPVLRIFTKKQNL